MMSFSLTREISAPDRRKMFKLIASDLDGTLLDSRLEVSDETVKVLTRAYEKGVDFVICTGRMYDSLKYILPKVPFCRYAITCMGAEIYDNFEKKRIYAQTMNPEYVRWIVSYGLKHNIHVNIYSDNVLYNNKIDEYTEIYFRETGTIANKIEGDVLLRVETLNITKLVYIDEPEKIKVYDRDVREHFGQKINICASSEYYVEMSAINAQKDITLNLLADRLNVKRDELIVFGDSGNDVAMLKNTGFSVCVANGWREAKAAADIIVESNDNDGVARTVKRLVLDER